MNETHNIRPIDDIIRRMKPLPRRHRIAHVRALLCQQMPGSARISCLTTLLRDEIVAEVAQHRGHA